MRKLGVLTVVIVLAVLAEVYAKAPQHAAVTPRNVPKVTTNPSQTAISQYQTDLNDYLQAVASKPDWQMDIDWARGDTGGVDCPALYMATYPECIYKGGRSCLMSKAIDSAHANNCSWAFQLTLITQCHNSSQAIALAQAGQQAICDYEKGLN